MKRNDYLTNDQRAALGNLPRTHENCMEKTGVARPGKTAQDKDRRVWSTVNSKHGAR